MTDYTEAVLIREAVRVLRERIQAASDGPWFSWIEGRDGRGGDSFIGTHEPDAGDLYVTVGGGYHPKWEADQDYIAMMNPVLGAALADWLEAEADAFEVYEAANIDKALVVAGIILREEADANKERQE